MFEYKREVANYDQARTIEYSFSDNSKSCFCTSGTLRTRKPYHGMYIRDGKVLLENVVETFEIEDKKYKVVDIETKSKDISSKEYLFHADLEKNEFEYSFGELSYTKRFTFVEKSGILCIEYIVKNTGRANAKFNVIPLITYRDYYNMKNSSMLKFNQRDTEDGTCIALSVLNQENLVLKSDLMNWNQDNDVLRDVKHEMVNPNAVTEVYYEDLAICGKFETECRGFSESKFYVYIGNKDFSLDSINTLEAFRNIETRNKNVNFNIDENFVELRDLAESILNTDMDTLVPFMPYRKVYNDSYIAEIEKLTEDELAQDLDEIIECVRAIEGQFLYFNKVKEAKRVVTFANSVYKELEKGVMTDKIKEKYNLLRLWYIEAVNRVLQKEGRIELYMDSIKDTLYDLVEPENRVTVFNSIEMVTLMLNAIKIYLNILTWIGDTDKQMEIQEVHFKTLIEKEFWIKEKSIMKRRLDDENHYANIEMIYALSLSFPCVSDEIPNRILDSVFKELYTPYGIREISKFSPLYDGKIYPKYMAHFIKANLRLTGVTRAAQKISYNLVKELLQDLGKHVNGATKKVYHENGKPLDCKSYDTLTNAEMIRLYNMFM